MQHAQMKDTHATNNPGGFLKPIVHRGRKDTAAQLPSVLSPRKSEPPSEVIGSLSSLPDHPCTRADTFALCTASLSPKSTKETKCNHKVRRMDSLQQRSRLSLTAAAGRGEGLAKAIDTEHLLLSPICLPSWWGAVPAAHILFPILSLL